MNNSKIRWQLFGTILVLSVIPMAASYFLLNEILESTISLTTGSNTSTIFSEYQVDLKKLRTLDPDNSEAYKTKYFQLEEELRFYKEPEIVKPMLRNTFLTYYFVLFFVTLLLSTIVALVLIGNVARSYKRLSKSDLAKSKRLQALRYFDEWQEIARKLAHEIKNPLTPIEIMVGNLVRNHKLMESEKYSEQLNESYQIVNEEINKLRKMVNHFSRFSKLPEPAFKDEKIYNFLIDFIDDCKNSHPRLIIELFSHKGTEDIYVCFDRLLLGQCLVNLLSNAEEANLSMIKISVAITLQLENEGSLSLTIHNSGKVISEADQKKIFNMYYSTKSTDDNMGLGLPIVKKNLFDHGGDIEYVRGSEGATFKMTLPYI